MTVRALDGVPRNLSAMPEIPALMAKNVGEVVQKLAVTICRGGTAFRQGVAAICGPVRSRDHACRRTALARRDPPQHPHRSLTRRSRLRAEVVVCRRCRRVADRVFPPADRYDALRARCGHPPRRHPPPRARSYVPRCARNVCSRTPTIFRSDAGIVVSWWRFLAPMAVSGALTSPSSGNERECGGLRRQSGAVAAAFAARIPASAEPSRGPRADVRRSTASRGRTAARARESASSIDEVASDASNPPRIQFSSFFSSLPPNEGV